LLGVLLLFIPGIIMLIRYSLYAPVVLIEGLEKKAAMRRARELASRSWRTIIIVSLLQLLIPSIINGILGGLVGASFSSKSHGIAREVIIQIFRLNQILVLPLMAIVPALLYIKMRQLGGESLALSLSEIEEGDADQSKWKQRMRTRLSLATPTSHKTPTGD
jgi:hypothetical protein